MKNYIIFLEIFHISIQYILYMAYNNSNYK